MAMDMNIQDLYDEYILECARIARECEAEGLPSNGATYELRVQELRNLYPELFIDIYDDCEYADDCEDADDCEEETVSDILLRMKQSVDELTQKFDELIEKIGV